MKNEQELIFFFIIGLGLNFTYEFEVGCMAFLPGNTLWHFGMANIRSKRRHSEHVKLIG